MSKTVVYFALIVVCAGIAGGAPLAPDSGSVGANLCLWLRMPEVNYDPAAGVWTDVSGKGNDALADIANFVGPTLSSGGNAKVFSHSFSTVHFDIDVPDMLRSVNLNQGQGLSELTIFVAVNTSTTASNSRAVGFGAYQDGGRADHYNLAGDLSIRKDNGSIGGATGTLPTDEFIVRIGRMDTGRINQWLNSDGTLTQVFDVTGSSYVTSNDIFYLGDLRRNDAQSGTIEIAEVVVFNTALTDAQIEGVSEWLQAFVGTAAKVGASGARPAHDAVDVPRDTVLSWNPVATAVKRDVYFGSVFEDVNNADTATPLNVLANQGQAATTYDPGMLEFGQTYYWRVDEVNKAPDSTVFRGNVWTFDVEPVAIPIDASIIATASGFNPGMEPTKTIDGSGLNELGQHSILGLDMWLTLTNGSWIQYEFDKAYKLHEMLVWNSNQIVETFIGFGVKDAVVETSLDGVTWTAVDGVPPFAQGSAQAAYEANTTVDLGGAVAKYVKISPQSAYGFTGQSGLSEVRFSSIPTDARELSPADGSTTADVEVTLDWRAGREAASHEVKLGTDPDSLVLAGTTDDPSFVTEGLDYAQTYYWQVVEVNEAEAPEAYASDILSFNTPAFATVDDFESYAGDEGEEVFMTWFDGFGGDASLGGSTTGHIDGPFVETANTHSGGKSMPVYVDNDGGFFDIDGKSSSPTFSEVVRDFDPAQDWTASGVKTLSIMFSGSTGLTGQLYCKIGNTKLLYDGDASNLGAAAWQAWNIDLSTVGGNLTSVRELAIGVEGGTSGILYIDDIRLYTEIGEIFTPVLPDDSDPSLVAFYQFEGNANDTKGNYHGTAEGEPGYVAGKIGQAMTFDGIDDQVVHAFAQEVVWPACSVGLWVRTDAFFQVVNNSPFNNNSSSSDFQFDVDGSDPGRYRYVGSATIVLGSVIDEWVHLAASCDGTSTSVYFNGLLIDSADIADNNFGQIAIGINRGMSKRFAGTIDDVRIYDRSLSQAEIAGLAGREGLSHKPL